MSQDAPVGKVPPHSNEAERAMMGALLLDPMRVADAAELLRPEDFFDGRHRLLFEVVLELADQNVPIDFVTVGEALTAKGELQKVGGHDYLVELGQAATSSAHLKYHAKLVSNNAMLRRLIGEASEIVREAYDTPPTGEGVSELLDVSESRILDISGSRDSGRAEPLSTALRETFQRIDASSGRNGLTGITTGYYELDELLCGMNSGDLVILAARPSMGKTALALNLALHAAKSEPSWLDRSPNVLVYSLEMGRQQLASRLLCMHARVDAHRLRTGRIPDEDRHELTVAADELQRLGVFIDDTPGLTMMSLRSRARRLKSQHGLDMIIVDYLQLLSWPRAESRQQEISNISRSLKELARELEVPVIALAQLSRAVESRDPPRPQLADLRESGSIEQREPGRRRGDLREATERPHRRREAPVLRQPHALREPGADRGRAPRVLRG
jgi:replicative DNA helicase